MNDEHSVVDNSLPWLEKNRGFFEFDRRATPLLDRGGLVSFKKRFTALPRTKNVKLSITALGVFEVYLNGNKIGDDEMKPGWTDYRHRVFEFEYDITDLCKKRGENILVACVAPGWYSGRVSYNSTEEPRCIYGSKGVALCAEITITDSEGHTAVFATDESWETAFGGRVRASDIYDGELYDARETCIFTSPESFNWKHAVFCGYADCKIVPHVGETVKLKRKGIAPVSAIIYDGVKDNGSDFGEINIVSKKVGNACEGGTLKKGQKLVIDFGVEYTARPRFKLSAPKDTVVSFFCGEMLNDSGLLSRGNDGAKGSIYINNYRTALSRIQYICDGGVAEYSPAYTFFGYRYLEIVPDNDIEIFYIVSDIIGTDLKRTGKIETSNAEVNKLIENIYRGLEANYLSIPTDCPQRDERLGWAGDTQIFCGAASYFVNAYGFLSKWMGDMCDSRDADGLFAVIAPNPFTVEKKFGAGAWSDAGIIVPYKMWLMYGDKTILEDNYDAMDLYVQGIYKKFGLRGPVPSFGDWLSYEVTPKDYVSVCYFAYDAALMEKISRILNKPEKAKYYAELGQEIKDYYIEQYVENDEFKVKTQTGFLLPLAFDMIDGELREKAIRELKANIVANSYTLTTGFVGTGLLNQTLGAIGLGDEAYSLLLQTRDPSWLYSVRQGATTVWERWNSYTLENGFGNVIMNSFNHYAYGAVAEWMFAGMAGISPMEEYPGFEKFVLAPTPDTRKFIPEGQERITSVKAEFESARGLIKAEWLYENEKFTYKVIIPSNTEARIEFPLLSDQRIIKINGIDFEESNDFKIQNNKMIFTLGSGQYVIQ